MEKRPGKLPRQVKRKQLVKVMYRWKYEISPLLPQFGRGSVAPRIVFDNWLRCENKSKQKKINSRRNTLSDFNSTVADQFTLKCKCQSPTQRGNTFAV